MNCKKKSGQKNDLTAEFTPIRNKITGIKNSSYTLNWVFLVLHETRFSGILKGIKI